MTEINFNQRKMALMLSSEKEAVSAGHAQYIANELIKEQKYHEFVLCMKSPFNTDVNMEGIHANRDTYANTSINWARMQEGISIPGFTYAGIIYNTLRHGAPYYSLNNPNTYKKERLIQSRVRAELEYNPLYVQFVVGGYITDGKSIVLLRNTDSEELRDELRNKVTFIQGHINPNPLSIGKSMSHTAAQNFLRELDEEVLYDKNIRHRMVDAGYIFIADESMSSEHMGWIVEYQVDNIDDFFASAKTNEPEKHDIILIDSYEQMKELEGDLDFWVKLFFKM